MAYRMGGPLDVPQHGAHETNHAQQARLDPHLHIEVMGMDEGCLAVVKVEILDISLHGRRTETRSGKGVLFDHFQRRGIQGEATGGR